MTVLLDLN